LPGRAPGPGGRAVERVEAASLAERRAVGRLRADQAGAGEDQPDPQDGAIDLQVELVGRLERVALARDDGRELGRLGRVLGVLDLRRRGRGRGRGDARGAGGGLLVGCCGRFGRDGCMNSCAIPDSRRTSPM
jgi:hypothetical protein